MNTLANKSYEEILDIFSKYEYMDHCGHDLLMCEDFIELVELAVTPPSVQSSEGNRHDH